MLELFYIVAVVITAVGITVMVEVETFLPATIVLFGTIGVLYGFNLWGLACWIRTHVLELSGLVLAYIVVGIIWSFIKWFSYLMRFREAFRKCKEGFMAQNNLVGQTVLPAELLGKFKDYMFDQRLTLSYKDPFYTYIRDMNKPRAADNKGRIVAWMSFWPFSALGTLFNDPIRRIFSWLFTAFKALYQRLADFVFRQDVELK